MFWYYFTFVASLIATAFWLNHEIGDAVEFSRIGSQPSLRTIAIMIIVMVCCWSWFLYVSRNLESKSSIEQVQKSPVRPSIHHTEWNSSKDAPTNGRVIWAVFSPGDTVLVRWLENRQVLQSGEWNNYGPGWAVISSDEEYPVVDPISWQMP